MAPTPQRRSLGRTRPSLGHSTVTTASSPNLASAYSSSQQRPPLPRSQLSTQRPNADSTRKASFSQQSSYNGSYTVADGVEGCTPASETGSSPFTMYPARPANGRTATDDKLSNQNLEVGDVVDVPGSMYGTIKFIGEIKGKKGHFAGVELSKEFAAKGKNDGDVDGVRYFTTSVRGAGIFLPSNKAYKRLSPSFSSDSMPLTPDTPNLGSSYLGARGKEPKVYTPTSSSNSKFTQSVGPRRARSPDLKPKSRPSLPRPESPLRKAQNAVSTPSARPSIGAPKLSKSMVGGARYAPSPSPGKFGTSMRGGATGDPGKRIANINKPTPKTPNNARPQSRSYSRLGPEAMFDDESDNKPAVVTKKLPADTAQQRSRPGFEQEAELKNLRQMLEMRDRQLEKQTNDLEEMQLNIAELQTVTPKHSSASTLRSRGSGIEELDAPALRAMVREKTETISSLTSEFDTHRAQFRNAIDSLERTSDETNRIYEQKFDEARQEHEQQTNKLEQKINELNQTVRELQDRGDDVESVAQQLKQLEELVQELEEGLEDARRGEAEARGEVEYLRGAVDRKELELRAERERAAASGSSRELEQRDDEIRGLKAIIHSLSRDSIPDTESPRLSSRRISKRHSNQANIYPDSQISEERQAREKLEREVIELEGLVDRKTYREEALEHEIERLRKTTAHFSTSSNGYSQQTAAPNGNHRPNLSKDSSNDRQEQMSPIRKHESRLDSMPESDTQSTTMTDSSTLYCEMCETFGHEIFTCPNINGDQPQQNGERPISSGRLGEERINEGLAISSPRTKDYPPPLSPGRSPARSPAATPKAKIPDPMDQGPIAGKESGAIDMGKWCALCERDGHESVDCPFEDMY